MVKRAGLACGRICSSLAASIQRKDFAPDSIVIVLRKPLGIGDLLMLAPFMVDVASRSHGLRVSILTEYRPIFSIDGIEWVSPEALDEGSLENALVISPTLSWRHARYLPHAGWHLGYFLSDRVSCNFSRVSARYDARRGHYLDRIVPLRGILDRCWPESAVSCSRMVLMEAPFEEVPLPSGYVCLAPFSNWPERQYPPEYWKKVIDGVRRRLPVVLVGGSHPDERAMACSLAVEGVINLVGRTSLGQLASVLAGSRLYLGNDSGPSHMAFLSAQASVVVFGCVGGKQRIPLDPGLSSRIRVLGNGSACPHFPCYDGFTKPECRNPEPCLCLTSVSPDAVLEEAFSILRGER